MIADWVLNINFLKVTLSAIFHFVTDCWQNITFLPYLVSNISFVGRLGDQYFFSSLPCQQCGISFHDLLGDKYVIFIVTLPAIRYIVQWLLTGCQIFHFSVTMSAIFRSVTDLRGKYFFFPLVCQQCFICVTHWGANITFLPYHVSNISFRGRLEYFFSSLPSHQYGISFRDWL